jgi:Flp pilus assembly protein TadG
LPPLLGCDHRSHGENGATLFETAVSLTLLMIFLVGIIEISWALYSYHYIADAAREGTRYAIVRGSDWGSSCSSYTADGCNASPANIEDFVASLDIGPIGLTTGNASSYVFVCYSATLPSSPMAACTTSASTNVPAAGEVVQVTITYPFTFGIPGFPGYTYHLSSSSEMVIAH